VEMMTLGKSSALSSMGLTLTLNPPFFEMPNNLLMSPCSTTIFSQNFYILILSP
jgi:hypothetical protein